MRNRIRFSAFALAAIVGATALANALGISLAHKPKLNETNRYKTVAKFNMDGMEGTATFVEVRKVIAVDDEKATYETKQESGMISIMGQDIPMESEGGSTTEKLNGEIINLEGPEQYQNYRVTNLLAFIRPNKEVEVGEEWTHKFAGNNTKGIVAAEAVYKVTGEEKVLGEDAWKIDFSYKEVEGDADGRASSKGTIWVSKTTNAHIKMTAKWTNAPLDPSMVMDADVTIELMK